MPVQRLANISRGIAIHLCSVALVGADKKAWMARPLPMASGERAEKENHWGKKHWRLRNCMCLARLLVGGCAFIEHRAPLALVLVADARERSSSCLLPFAIEQRTESGLGASTR
jgi:hypothetical protein